MTVQGSEPDAVARLSKLADDLQAKYEEIGEKVAAAIKPIDEAIQKIGVAYDHVVCSNEPQYFHKDSDSAGTCYQLCAARGDNEEYHLLVAVHSGKIDERTGLACYKRENIAPNFFKVPIRALMLPVLHDFAEKYLEHVKRQRGGILKK